MPYVSPTNPNTFYIAANIIFDTATGETRSVLMLVNRPEDASVFTAADAQNYLNFVSARAQKIVWTIEQLNPTTPMPPFLRKAAGLPDADRFVIKGVQYV